MAQVEGNKEYNTFVKGLITEANPLSFPDNASIDESNFELLRTGQRIRRSGLDWEGETPGIVTETDGNWIIASTTDDIWRIPGLAKSTALDRLVHTGAPDTFYYSDDGENWTAVSGPGNVDGNTINDRYIPIAYSPSLDRFVALGRANNDVDTAVAYSTDGITWNSASFSGDDGFYNNLPDQLIWSTIASRFIAVADTDSVAIGTAINRIKTSTDGITWENTGFSPLAAIRAVAEGDGVIVAGGHHESSSTDHMFYSFDGLSWNVTSIPVDLTVQSIAYSETQGLLVATTGTNTFLRSTDGISWEDFTVNPDSSEQFTFISWIEELDKFFVFGLRDQGSFNFIGYVASSEDGITWTGEDIATAPNGFPSSNLGYFGSAGFSTAGSKIAAAGRAQPGGGTGEDEYRTFVDVTTTQQTDEVVDVDTEVLKTSLWRTKGTDGELTILVVQTGTILSFYDANAADIIAAPLNGGISIDIGGDPSVAVETAEIFGKLVVVNGQKGFIYLEYDPIDDDVTVEARIILVRDIWGIHDPRALQNRTPNLPDWKEYNLVNSGWGPLDTADTPWVPLYRRFAIQLLPTGSYPAASDIVSLARNSTGHIDAFQAVRSGPGYHPAPKGYFIIDAFRRGTSREIMRDRRLGAKTTDLSGDLFALSKFIRGGAQWDGTRAIHSEWDFNLDSTRGGITCAASYAARTWFAGASSRNAAPDDNSPNLGSYIFFSQIAESEDNIGRCYSHNDPTSEDSPDPLDTDGGAVKIPGMQGVFKLIETGRSLVIFADNGIWEISGGETNFSATNFEINKISNTSALSKDSVVEVEGAIFFWAEEGIYLLQPDQVTMRLTAQNITEGTIQSFYNDIPSQVKKVARGAYDPVSRKVRWLYSEDATVAEQNNITLFDSELILDMVLNAFYKFNISSDSDFFLADYVITNEVTSNEVTEVVEDSNGDTVEDSNNEDVVITRNLRILGNTSTKFVAADNLGHFGIALYKDPLFEDFGEDAEAFLLTGYETLQDTMKDKQAPYIVAHFEATETFIDANNKEDESSCLLQGQWDFADDASSEKFGPSQQVYRYPKHFLDAVAAGTTTEYGKLVLSSKTKLRGRGRALSLLFKSEPQKDLRIYGWGVKYTGVSGV